MLCHEPWPTGYNIKKQARGSRVRTNFTYLLATLENSFMPNPSLDKDSIPLSHFRHSQISECTIISSSKFQF